MKCKLSVYNSKQREQCFDKMSRLFMLFSNARRRKIILLLLKIRKPICVTDIGKRTDMDVSDASREISRMRDFYIFDYRKETVEGRARTFYTLKPETKKFFKLLYNWS